MKRKKASTLILICLLAVFSKSTAGSNPLADRPNEIIFLQTDRDIYIAGEHLFFSAELIPCPHSDEPLSEIAYLALRNRNQVIESVSLSLDQNRFSGSLYLPDTLSTGYFELIGFTNWMRNYDESCFFKTTILVVNRFDNALDFLKVPPLNSGQAGLSFYPEGGQLIAGLEQKLLVSTPASHPLPFAAIILLSESGDTIQTASLNEMGWTTLKLVPREGQRVFALISGRDERYYLPEPDPTGYMLKINPSGGHLGILIATNNFNEQKPSLVIYKNGQPYEELTATVSSNKSFSTEIPMVDLDQGIYGFRLIGQEGETLAEREWYIDKRKVNHARVALNQPAYGRRVEVKLDILLEDPEDEIEWVTVSAIPSAGRVPQRIDHHLFQIAVDLIQARGIFPTEAVQYLRSLGREDLNELLIRPLPGRESPDETPVRSFRFSRETSHLTLTGKISDASTLIPVVNARIVLNAPDTIVNLLYTQSNEEGLFTFFLDNYYDDREIYLTPDPQTIPAKARIEVLNKFDFKTTFHPEPFYLPVSYRETIAECQEMLAITKAFETPAPLELMEETTRAEPVRVFSEPVYSIRTDEFIPLDNLQEIAREIIGPWKIRTNRSGTTHHLISQTTSLSIPGSPVLFIDGIITYDLEPLLPLNSRQIKKLQIHNLEWKHGELHFPGIVAIFTRNEEFRTLDLSPEPVRFFNIAHQFPARFVSPVYPGQGFQPGQPDLRPLLFWYSGKPSPGNGPMEFIWYTGDLLMDYQINIEGITRKGDLLNLEIPLPYER